MDHRIALIDDDHCSRHFLSEFLVLKGFSVDSFKLLMKPFVKTGKHICVLLRIAVLLHRGRTSQPVPDIGLVVDDKNIALQFPKNWLNENSMTLADLIKEISHLDNAGYRLSFE